jgi:hypothetical protein
MKYPIKYMPMHIVEDNKIKAYVVVKCYVLDSYYIQEVNGEKRVSYKVVPFYDSQLNKQDIVYINDQCINYTGTRYVFDDEAEAFRFTRALNRTRIIDYDDKVIRKYENIAFHLLHNENDKIIDFNIARQRLRKREDYE